MAHDYHDALPGYHPDQILHDGCEEREQRARTDSHGIAQLDRQRFVQAWVRAADFNQAKVRNASVAEAPMLNALWVVQLQLERRGQSIGTLPAEVWRL